MDERIWTIAEILDQSGPMTADELAAQLKLSGKTVRSLIKTYAKEMQENGFCITAKPGRGFGIEITDAQTYVSGSKPQQGEQTGIPQDAQERIQRLRQYLLEKDGYSKLDDLSEQFFVSRRSISNDLREVERQLAEYGLSIRRKPGYGICVVGRETNRRICIAAQRDESRPVGQQIQELVSRVLEKEKFAMSTMALDNLAVHLEVAVERIRTGHAIESSDGMQADLPERILEVASHIAVQIENMTGVAFPLPEVCYIAMHLNGKQMYRANAMTSDENLVIPQEVNRIVSDMIEQIYEAFRIDFRDNLELRMGLCMHMVPLLARIKSGMRMKNPILQGYQAGVSAGLRDGHAGVQRVAAGQTPSSPITYGFWVAFVVLPVSLPVCLAIFLVSKREDYRAVAKVAIGPALFGISEPMVFGLPLVLNTTMLIPSILSVMLCSGTALFASTIGFMPCNTVDVAFGTPVLLSALIGHGWQGVVVQIIGLALATLVYIPFMIIANKQAEAEQAAQN